MAGRIGPASRYTGRMTETTLYEKLLGIERPWRVRGVRLALDQGDVEVRVEFAGDWLKVASFAAVARQCRLSWDQVAGIQERAVRRGLSRRPAAAAQAVGVD